jgi:tetratricopeptide (TPR) repeat protein
MLFKGTNKTLPEIARALRVDAVVEGSVMMMPGPSASPEAGDSSNGDARRLRINARLIRAGTDTQLWDRTFEAASADVFALQRQIAAAVADGIHATLTPETNAAAQPAGQGAARFDAFDVYLKGRYYWSMRTPDALKQSVPYFQEAIGRGYVPAYAGLADAYNMLGFYGLMPAADARRRALETATKGLELDPSLAEAYASRGFAEHEEFKWQAAEDDFRRSVELNPTYATGHHWYALFLEGQGRLDEAFAHLRTAAALDPLSVAVNGQLGWSMVLMHRYDDAIVQMQQTVAMDPTLARNRLTLAEAYALKGDYGQALTVLDQTSASGDEEIMRLRDVGYVYAQSGRRVDASKVIATLVDRERQHAAGATGAIATVYAGLGDRDRAMAALTRAWTARDPIFMAVKVDPLLDSLHGDPRFAKLLATAGLPQ